MRTRAFICALFALGIASQANAQATITIINNDAPGEGFNDPTPVTPVAGNPGTTLGQQRLIAFQAAADDWETVITSSVEITVDAALDALTPCNASSGVLGRAGTVQVFRDFPGAPQANTWYPSALANALSGVMIASSGQQLLFSIIANDRPPATRSAIAEMDAALVLIAERY